MKIHLFLLALLLVGSSVNGADEPEPKLNGEQLYDKAMAASVEILVEGRHEGSGWFATSNGLIITAAHVVESVNDRKLEVTSPTIGRITAHVVAFDYGHDIALIEVPKSTHPYPFFRMAKKMPYPGEEVFLFGLAHFRHHIMIKGAMARKSPTYEYLSKRGNYIRVYHITAPSPPGTSGGCWLNSQAEVIGTQSAFVSQDKIGLGIALSAAPDAIARLIRTRKTAEIPSVGTAFEELWTQPVGFISRFPEDTRGMVPVLPAEGGPAEKAGLTGDIVISHINDIPLTFRDTLLEILRAKKPNDEVVFTVLRPDGGITEKIKVTISKL